MPQAPHPRENQPQHVILHDSQATGVTVFVAQPLEDPLRGVPLLRWTPLIILQDLIDDPDERVQLRPCRRAGGCAGTRAEPRRPTSSLPSEDPARTDAPSRDDSDPRSAPNGGPACKAPRFSSPSPLHPVQRAICRGIFAPAQPDFLAASMRDFLSGAYSESAALRQHIRDDAGHELRFDPGGEATPRRRD